MRLRTLGRVVLEDLDGARSPGPKALFLLAYLALEGPKERRFLAELLWRDATDPRNRLSTALSRIRRCHPGLIRADAVTVGARVRTDVEDFLAAWRDGRFEDAVGLYGGPFLEGFDADGNVEVEDWLHEIRDDLVRRLVEALVTLAEGDASAGEAARSVQRAERAHRHLREVGSDPRIMARLHAVLDAAGSPAAVALAEEAAELGIDLTASAARARSPDDAAVARSIPGRRGAIFGRERELASLAALLPRADVRLVTLVGPGGVGKSRLAIETAWRLREASAFRDGVAFVPLASVRAPGKLLDAVADTLGVREDATRDRPAALLAALAGRETLLVLDNAEHVLEAAPLVGHVLEACESVTILATSRAPLRLAVERQVPVAPLPTAATAGDGRPAPAVALFVARATAIDPTFAPSSDDLASVAALCARLDGLPLALELAAARIKLMSPAQMIARLDRRLDLLGDGFRDASERHRTMRRAIAWSYDLLSDDERRVFRRISILDGRFPLEAAEALAGPAPGVMDRIARLVDHHLVRSEPDAPGRFTMLETIREYGRELLDLAGEREEAEHARASYLTDLVGRASRELTGPRQRAWFERLADRHADIGQALDFLEAAGEGAAGLRLGAPLWRYWIARGHMREGRDRLTRSLAAAAPDDAADARAEALEGLGIILQELGDPRAARARLLEALGLWERIGEDMHLASTLNHLAWLALNLGDLWEAEAHARRALGMHRERGDARGEAVSLNNLGWIALYRGDPAAAEPLLADALHLRERAGDTRGIAFAQANLAWPRRLLGRTRDAEGLLTRAAETAEALRDDQILGWIRYHQVALALDHDRVDAAHDLARDGLRRSLIVGNRSGIALAHASIADVQLRRGALDEARRAALQAHALATDLSERWTEAVAASLLGRIRLAAGDVDAGRADLLRAAELHREMGDRSGLAEALATLAERGRTIL